MPENGSAVVIPARKWSSQKSGHSSKVVIGDMPDINSADRPVQTPCPPNIVQSAHPTTTTEWSSGSTHRPWRKEHRQSEGYLQFSAGLETGSHQGCHRIAYREPLDWSRCRPTFPLHNVLATPTGACSRPAAHSSLQNAPPSVAFTAPSWLTRSARSHSPNSNSDVDDNDNRRVSETEPQSAGDRQPAHGDHLARRIVDGRDVVCVQSMP